MWVLGIFLGFSVFSGIFGFCLLLCGLGFLVFPWILQFCVFEYFGGFPRFGILVYLDFVILGISDFVFGLFLELLFWGWYKTEFCGFLLTFGFDFDRFWN